LADRRKRKSAGQPGIQQGGAGTDRFNRSCRNMKPDTQRVLLKTFALCAAAAAALAVTQPSLACIWDSDTLDRELKKFPGIEQVITGRFERNPPLYYQMRLTRASQEVR